MLLADLATLLSLLQYKMAINNELKVILFYLIFSVSRGFSGRVTDIRRSQVTSVSSSVDDWQLKVLKKPASSANKS